MNSVEIKRIVKLAKPFSETVFRSTALKYAKPDMIISGAGSAKTGARWNPKGLNSLYGSFTPDAAMAETLAYFRYYSIPVHTAMPRTFVAIRMKLKKVLDLTNAAVHRAGKFSDSDYVNVDWHRDVDANRQPSTQNFGSKVFEEGLEGLIFASAAAENEKNIVCFVDNLHRSSSIEVLSADQL